MFRIYQGETIYINITVLDEAGEPANLTNATAKFVCTKGTETIKKACSIAGNVVTAKLEPADTKAMLGKYLFEVKTQDILGDIDTLQQDYLEVLQSIIPDYTAE